MAASKNSAATVAEPLIKTSDVARLTGLSRDTLKKLRTDERGPKYVAVSKSGVRYRASDVLKWLASRERVPASE